MRTSSKMLVALPVLLFVLTGAQNLFANSQGFTFTISSSTPGFGASGTFTANLVSGNEYVVTSILGTQNGSVMTLLAPGAYAANNNEIFSSSPFLNLGGLAFVLSNGATQYNIYYAPSLGAYFECSSSSRCSVAGDGTAIKFSLTQVPEPGTLMLLGSGLVGLAGMARRRKLLR